MIKSYRTHIENNADRTSQMNREWTADDDALVREFAPKISLQRLAVRMKRSESSIKSRARSLGVETTKVVRLTREQRTGF